MPIIQKVGVVKSYEYVGSNRNGQTDGMSLPYGHNGAKYNHNPHIYLEIESNGVCYTVDIYHQLSSTKKGPIMSKGSAIKTCKNLIGKIVEFEFWRENGHGAITKIYNSN